MQGEDGQIFKYQRVMAGLKIDLGRRVSVTQLQSMTSYWRDRMLLTRHRKPRLARIEQAQKSGRQGETRRGSQGWVD